MNMPWNPKGTHQVRTLRKFGWVPVFNQTKPNLTSKRSSRGGMIVEETTRIGREGNPLGVYEMKVNYRSWQTLGVDNRLDVPRKVYEV